MHHLIGNIIFNGFGLLPESVEAFLRAGAVGPPFGPRGMRAKMFRAITKDQIHLISNQMMHSIVGKGKNPLNIHSND